MADTSEVVYAGLNLSDAGEHRVVLPDHDTGVVAPSTDHVLPGNLSFAEEKSKEYYMHCCREFN